ncbi:MAG: protoporphyrinogen oxidase HemJ [Parvibaculaceae bacterium]|nr:protoporphyrinogen oxidase HemJ [Parvibaculaceae bacterium]
MDFLADAYPWIKAFHVIAVIFWMAGMAYLPRLFVYHADAAVGSELSETFKIMERRLLRGIINPSMILALILGVLLIVANPALMTQGWLHAKLTLVVLMLALHGMFSKYRKAFERDQNRKSAKFFRIINEAPPLLVVFIVILVIVRPF